MTDPIVIALYAFWGAATVVLVVLLLATITAWIREEKRERAATIEAEALRRINLSAQHNEAARGDGWEWRHND